jgi:tetratricopeptide (TPR) repeat protein
MNNNNPQRQTSQANNVNNGEPVKVFSTFKKPDSPRDPEGADGYFKLAMVNYLITKDFEKGMGILEYAFSTDDTIVKAYEYEFKLKISEKGKVDRSQALKLLAPFALDYAIKTLKKVISLDPEHTDAYYNLGICYSETGQIDRSVDMFRKVLELDTNPRSDLHESSIFNLGNQLVKKREYQEAVQQFEKILENNSRVIDALYNAAFIYFRYLNEYDKAISYFERIINLFSLHMDARYNLGLCYYLKDDKEKAMEIWEKLVQINGNYGPAYYNLALTNKELGHKQKAMLFFQKYLDIPVKDPGQYRYAKQAKRRLKQLQEEGDPPKVNG